jgi:hypothetical protein
MYQAAQVPSGMIFTPSFTRIGSLVSTGVSSRWIRTPYQYAPLPLSECHIDGRRLLPASWLTQHVCMQSLWGHAQSRYMTT